LHIGYIPIPTAEILPRALEAFRKAVPRVKLVLDDLSTDELIAGLRDGTLELATMVQPIGEQTAGIEFETFRSYRTPTELPSFGLAHRRLLPCP
jgi:DNA-binding transcriptional LysR family regulator